MVDSMMTKIGSKTFNVRVNVDYADEAKTTLKVHVLQVSEVDRTSQTSSRKIKDVYVSSPSSSWNPKNNTALLNKLVSALASKYKVSTVNYY